MSDSRDPDTRDLVHIFADHAANLRYDDLSPSARDAAKQSILDTLGVILAASGMEPAVQAVIEIVRETGGTGAERTVLNASGYVTARRAATVSSKVTGKVVEVDGGAEHPAFTIPVQPL